MRVRDKVTPIVIAALLSACVSDADVSAPLLQDSKPEASPTDPWCQMVSGQSFPSRWLVNSEQFRTDSAGLLNTDDALTHLASGQEVLFRYHTAGEFVLGGGRTDVQVFRSSGNGQIMLSNCGPAKSTQPPLDATAGDGERTVYVLVDSKDLSRTAMQLSYGGINSNNLEDGSYTPEDIEKMIWQEFTEQAYAGYGADALRPLTGSEP